MVIFELGVYIISRLLKNYKVFYWVHINDLYVEYEIKIIIFILTRKIILLGKLYITRSIHIYRRLFTYYKAFGACTYIYKYIPIYDYYDSIA